MSLYTHTPFSGALEDLPRYVNQELLRIEAALFQDAGGASLFHVGIAAPRVITDVPALFDDFDSFTPLRYIQNVIPDVDTDALHIARPGIWGVAFTISGEVDLNRSYRMQLRLDGVPVPLVHTVDPSNQTNVVTMTAVGTARIDGVAGATSSKLELFMDTDGGEAAGWTTRDAFFSAWWCGD